MYNFPYCSLYAQVQSGCLHLSLIFIQVINYDNSDKRAFLSICSKGVSSKLFRSLSLILVNPSMTMQEDGIDLFLVFSSAPLCICERILLNV